MKHVFWLLFLSATIAVAQPSTEVYLMDLNPNIENFGISNIINITKDPGYDNQPSFMDNENLLLAKNNDGQTDIQAYNFVTKKRAFIHTSTPGGEYSPQLIPNTNDVAAVRLDKDGKQRLYKYEFASKKIVELIEEIEVAYYAFHDQNRIIASILAGNKLDLVVIDLAQKEAFSYIENAGRSIHKVPEASSVSYSLVNEEKNIDIYLLDIDEDGESFFVCQLPVGIQDYAWINETTLIAGSGAELYLYDLFGDGEWKQVADLSEFKLQNITRLAVSPDKKKLALVAEPISEEKPRSVLTEPADAIVQKHLLPFNNRDLDAFTDAFAEDVIVSRFPNDIMYEGKEVLRENYKRYFKRTKESNVEVSNRITLGDYVIDEETARVDGKSHRQVTIYKTANGKIASMNFIHEEKSSESPVEIVQKQLDAYNNRDIDAFLATYAENVEVYNYPHIPQYTGQETMRNSYEGFFQSTPDLHCAIKTRLVINNKVIDLEDVTINGKQYPFIAIYEVENDKISKVTFVR